MKKFYVLLSFFLVPTITGAAGIKLTNSQQINNSKYKSPNSITLPNQNFDAESSTLQSSCEDLAKIDPAYQYLEAIVSRVQFSVIPCSPDIRTGEGCKNLQASWRFIFTEKIKNYSYAALAGINEELSHLHFDKDRKYAFCGKTHSDQVQRKLLIITLDQFVAE